MAEQAGSDPRLSQVQHEIRNYAKSDEDLQRIWSLWQTIFPTWPIERQRLEKILHLLPGQHYLHENGFCISFLGDGGQGKIAAIGVLPDYRGQGLGTCLLETAKAGLRDAARADGGELKTLRIGSTAPRFWPQFPTSFPPEVRDFFVHRGFRPSTDLPVRDFYKDIRGGIAPPDVLEKAAKTKLKFSPLTPELYEECVTKQKANFSWFRAYEILGQYDQFQEAMVAIDPDTNAQVGWTLMCSHSALISDTYAFLPLTPSKEKTGLIAAVGVDKDVRGKGVGLALIVNALENLRERGIDGVFIDSTVLKGFYEQFGFEPHWEYEDLVYKETGDQDGGLLA